MKKQNKISFFFLHFKAFGRNSFKNKRFASQRKNKSYRSEQFIFRKESFGGRDGDENEENCMGL